MRHITWALALTLSLAWAGDARAQYLPYYSYGGGYGQGGGLGFGYQRRGLSIFGFLGGFSGSRTVIVDPIGPPLLGPPVVYSVRPVIVIQQGAPRRGRPTVEESTEGIDLDLVPPKKKPTYDPEPPGPEPPLPGKIVSKPTVPPVRPKEPPKPPEEPPPPKAKELPKKPPAPEADPKLEGARLVKLGLTAFSEETFGLAAHRFRQAAAADPKAARAHFLLAQAWLALGKYGEAVEAIHAGMRLHKNWPRAPFQPRVDLYGGIEPTFAEHLKRLDEAVKAAPKRPALKFLLAYELWFDGRRDEAVPLFRQARALAPDPTFIDQFLAAAAPGPVAAWKG
jgi:tetratricopeptide (TPR) repeat protein